jgi:hypothetical protein
MMKTTPPPPAKDDQLAADIERVKQIWDQAVREVFGVPRTETLQ